MELLKKLINSFGPSGYETEISKVITDEIKGHVDEIKVDRLGNIIAYKKGAGKGKIMISSHMDQIGVAATEVDDKGYLTSLKIGQFNHMNFLFNEVVFENGTVGVLSASKYAEQSELKWEDLFIDLGAVNKEEAESMVSPGSIGIFRQNFVINKKSVLGGCLDSRIGCYTSIEALKRVKASESDLYFVFTVQEETYRGGAVAAAYSVNPDCALLIDSMDADDMPGVDTISVSLGGGPGIKVMDKPFMCSREIKNALEKTAKDINVKYQFELSKRRQSSGAGIQTTKSGILTGGISIPVRYRYTPRQAADINDIESGIKLLTIFIESFHTN